MRKITLKITPKITLINYMGIFLNMYNCLQIYIFGYLNKKTDYYSCFRRRNVMKKLDHLIGKPFPILLAFLMFMPLMLHAAWYNSSWLHRKSLTVDNTKVAANLTNSAVLISITDTDLRDDAQNDGDDILFTSSDGTTKLSHEIEKFDGSTGELVAWVKVPTLSSSSDTVLYMYYGNGSSASQQDASNVWDSNYKSVLHMKEDPSGTAPQMRDSTSNSNHATSLGSMTSGDLVSGKIDGSLDFDAADDYLRRTYDPDFDFGTGSFSVSGWFKTTGPAGSLTGEASSETINVRVSQSADDAEQYVSSGSMDLTSSDLELADESYNQEIGLRFQNINITPGATIVSASIQFTVDETGSGTTNLTFYGEDTDNASTFTSLSNNITGRTKTSASTAWSNIPAWSSVGSAGTDQKSPNLNAVIQEIVDRPGWSSGNSLVIIAGGTGTRTAESYDGSSSQAPLLTVTFTLEQELVSRFSDNGFKVSMREDGKVYAGFNDDSVWSADPDVALVSTNTFDDNNWHNFAVVKSGNSAAYLYMDGSLEDSSSVPATAVDLSVRVSAGSDDAEEDTADGSIDLTSSDLELTYDSSSGEDQEVGIRFQNVSIPQGATINSAYIQFTVDETGSGTTNLTFYGEDTDNASAFTSTSNNITGRTKTSASVAWNGVPAWTSTGAAGADQKTPDLKTIIQEIVNREGWASGNSLVFIVDGTGSRTAESYEGNSDEAPLLLINYELPFGSLSSSSNAPLHIGADSPTADRYFSGIVDEVRISNTIRSADRIQTEYNNQNSPSSFYSVGVETIPPNIQFTSTSSSGSEGTTPANLGLTLSAVQAQDVTVDYELSGTATGSGIDYTLAPGTATITAGSTTANITAVIVDDSLNEANETMIVTISNPSNATLGSNTTHTYTISNNDDLPTVAFTATSSSASEGTTPANLQLTLSAASGRNVTVDYMVTGGTATGSGTDYTLASGTATITAGNTTTNIAATIVDDSTGESNETIIVTLSSPSNATLGSNTVHTYTITDNDSSKIVLTSYPSSVTAGSWTTVYTVQRQDATGNPITTGTTTITASSDSDGAEKEFNVSASPPPAPPAGGSFTVTITNGNSSANFYHYDEKAGSWTVSVSATGLTGDSKSLSVNPASTSYLKVTGTASMTAAGTNELTITAYDTYGNVATGYAGSKSLTFSGPANATSGTVPTVEGTNIGSSTSVSFTSGVSASNAATLIAYKAESTTVDVTDGSVNSMGSASLDLDLTVNAASAANLMHYSGNNQTGIVATALSNFFVVKVTDTYENPVNGKTVTWAITTTPASASGQNLSSASTDSDSSGYAQSKLTLGSKAGTYKVQASATSVTGSPVTFTATANAGSAATLTLVSGSCQSGSVSASLSSPFVVKVTDSQSNVVSGVSVGWTITTDPYGSSGASMSSATTVTDSNGQTQSTLTIGNKAGLYKVTAAVSGLSVSPVTFTATNGATVYLEGGSYYKLSLPYSFGSGNAETVLSQLGSYNPSNWRLFRYANGAYVEYPSTPDFSPGLAYWLISNNDITLSISGSTVGSNVTVTLAPGWNQIGNPFKCTVTWDDIKAANSAIFDNSTITDVLWGYDPEYLEFVSASAVDAWQGFWVYNATDSTVDFIIPYQ